MARAVFESVIPVISAVGHEPDVTISDFVADLRAATPSNAAELAVPDIADMRETLKSFDLRAGQTLGRELQALRRRLTDLQNKRVLQSPKNTIDDKRLMLDFAQERLNSAALSSFKAAREQYIHLAASLDAMSPLKVLGRGYAVVQSEDGRVIKKASEVKNGDKITVQLQKDKLTANGGLKRGFIRVRLRCSDHTPPLSKGGGRLSLPEGFRLPGGDITLKIPPTTGAVPLPLTREA